MDSVSVQSKVSCHTEFTFRNIRLSTHNTQRLALDSCFCQSPKENVHSRSIAIMRLNNYALCNNMSSMQGRGPTQPVQHAGQGPNLACLACRVQGPNLASFSGRVLYRKGDIKAKIRPGNEARAQPSCMHVCILNLEEIYWKTSFCQNCIHFPLLQCLCS